MTSPFAREDDPVAASEPRLHWERWLGYAITAIAAGYVFWQLNPGIAPWRLEFGSVLTDTTANGGDMGAHVWWPAFLRDHWFGSGRIAGWAPDWYAGFPVGQFYFPFPALAIVGLDLVVPYNIAFKLVAISGGVLLPISAHVFARGVRAPWPAPPLFALAAVRYLFEVRNIDGENTWTIYGGNLASLLAGEFSYTLALAFALLFLGTLGMSLETGKRSWIPAVFLAATVMSHIVVAMFAAVGALLIWLVRRSGRTFALAAAIGGVGFLLTAVWTVPLLATQKYTTSMRYGKVTDYAEFLLRLPGWLWILMFVAVVAAGWWRRTATLVLVAMAVVFGLLFRFWPEHHVWNTRFLPFYYLCVAFLGALGAVEIIRHVAAGAVWVVDWVRVAETGPGDRAVETPGDATPPSEHGEVFEARPVGEPAADLLAPTPPARDGEVMRRRRIVEAAFGVGLLVVLVAGMFVWLDDNRAVVPAWARWNFTGYEAKAAWPEYRNLVATMDELGRDQPGRAFWEGGGDVNNYGTTLALELLPYWTDGRIGSLEGLYFESAATTPFHFLTVSELAAPGNASNPVRGLLYGTSEEFDLGVEHLKMLGVTYFLAHADETIEKARAHPDLSLVAEVPDADGVAPFGWSIFEVADPELVVALEHAPFVVDTQGGTTSECFPGAAPPEPGGKDPELSAWECAAAPWWRDGALLDRPFVEDGPDAWPAVDVPPLGASSGATPEERLARFEPLARAPVESLPEVRITNVSESPDEIRFDVDRVGVPVLVRSSYFPNWHAHGAEGPWRISPNFMVVIPTSESVRLTYDTTGAEWLGRLLTLLGVVGVVLLARFGHRVWRGRVDRRVPTDRGAEPARAERTDRDPDEPAGAPALR